MIQYNTRWIRIRRMLYIASVCHPRNARKRSKEQKKTHFLEQITNSSFLAVGWRWWLIFFSLRALQFEIARNIHITYVLTQHFPDGVYVAPCFQLK